MDRLQTELQRLYLPQAALLELARPARWSELAPVWQGVQVDLQLPAPAIAVSGVDAYQLWFAWAEPVPADQAMAFLEGLRRRYLAGIAPERVRLQLSAALPPAQLGPERWSAFVAADLAPLFDGEPWLDRAPGTDAQAELLSRVKAATPEAFARALAQLTPSEPEAAPAAASAASAADGNALDPRGFLLSVMRDPAVDLRLRIDAAKALLGTP